MGMHDFGTPFRRFAVNKIFGTFGAEFMQRPRPVTCAFLQIRIFLPLFWVFGALILRRPFSPEPSVDLENGKCREWTKGEVEVHERIRIEERKWGRRCLWALLTLTLLTLVCIAAGLSVGLTLGRRER
ncbi:hypothetical protein PM082_011637 [Marasmius tenuissimus]|nr:hypothetical protein PM082_011637 [Marasmius tenuissimus]